MKDTKFKVEKRHSNRKNKDYYCVILEIGGEDVILAFITESQYNRIVS